MDKFGLTSARAQNALKQYGPNKLPDKKATPLFHLIVNQFKNMLSFLLFLAAAFSFVVGDRIDGFLITFILILNAGLGFWQEYKANRELEALKRMQSPTARVIRDGQEVEIKVEEIVPGDLIVLEAGSKIPADCYLTESHELSVNEAALTGESLPVIKTTDPDDRQIYFGTVVVSGRGKAIVSKTGQKTKFGSIATTLSNIEEEKTVFETSLENIAKKVSIFAIALAVVLFIVRFLQGSPLQENFFTSIALMVAAVPEGLPSVITLTLALGVRRMYKQKALIRRLGSIQDLGAVTVICTDKTGTITKNEMRVQKIDSAKNTKALIETAVLCNSASLVSKGRGLPAGRQGFEILGDTTEGALLLWAQDQGDNPENLRSEGKLLDEVPFSLDTRMMITAWSINGKKTIHVKGAPETVLNLCKLPEKEKQVLIKKYQSLAKLGLRVLAFGNKQSFSASKNVTTLNNSLKDQAKGLNFLGFVGIADEERPEAKQAILEAKRAGIKVIMITGDNELTAKAIGEKVGLVSGTEVMTGTQLQALSEEELIQRLDNISIFARVLPEHKLRIIQTLQKKGEIVAVTGDGVNDSLALKQAQVGLAMGITGTDVAKEASDIIILDDNFATIVKAIEQGRLIYNNISKILKFLMTGNLSEVLVVVGGVVLGFPTPLLAIQILWVNFVTDGLPALALAADMPSKKVMYTPPVKNAQNILDLDTLKFIGLGGLVMSTIVLGIYIASLNAFGLEVARGFAFSSLVVIQMVFVFLLRRHHGIWSNKYLLVSVGFVLLMQVAIMTIPSLRVIFKV